MKNCAWFCLLLFLLNCCQLSVCLDLPQYDQEEIQSEMRKIRQFLKTFLSFAPSPVLTLSVSEHLLTVQLKIDYSDYLSCSRNKIEKKIKESLKCYTQNKEKKYFTS